MSDDLYPVGGDEDPDRIRLNVRLSEAQHAELELVVDLWNAFDEELGIKRRKWSANSVVERMIEKGLAQFWSQLGSRPVTGTGREDFIATAVAKVKARHSKKK